VCERGLGLDDIYDWRYTDLHGTSLETDVLCGANCGGDGDSGLLSVAGIRCPTIVSGLCRNFPFGRMGGGGILRDGILSALDQLCCRS